MDASRPPSSGPARSRLAVLDHQGHVIAANEAWLLAADDPSPALAGCRPGGDFVQWCEAHLDHAAGQAASGLRQVLAGDMDTFVQTLGDPGHRTELSATRLPHQPHVLVTLEDVADREAQATAQIIDNIQEAFFALDRDWRVTYLNARAEALLDRPAAELLGRSLWETFPHALLGRYLERYQTVVREQRRVSFEEYDAALNRWAEIAASPLGDGIGVFFQDVTDRKAEEQAQADRNGILEMIVQNRPLPEILQQVTAMLERQYPGYHALLILDQAERQLVTAPSLPPPALQLLQAVEGDIRRRLGWTRPAATGDFAMVVDDLQDHPVPGGTPAPPGDLGACAFLPIRDGLERSLGVLGLCAPPRGMFDEPMLAALGRARHLTAVAIEHHRLTEQLVTQANTDALTGLANRQLFERRLCEALQAAAPQGQQVSLLFIDIDDFKGVNDSLGHQAGDQALQHLARRLQGSVRPSDTLARISGDEFTVIMPAAGEAEAVAAAEALLEALARPLVWPGHELHVTASIGISVSPEGGLDPQTMQKSADFAMYEAKAQQSGICVFHQALAVRASRRFDLGRALRTALDRQELRLHYQPVVALDSGQVVGAEALVRWHHPALGSVPPAEFIPVAEETGLIVPVGEWVLREACRQGAEWTRAGRAPLRLAVNVSALQFERPDFAQTVAAALQETGFPATDLTLELTERVVMQHAEEAVQRMQALRDLGVAISLDDFGTGYSSLSYLSRFPLNVLKIDRSFVSSLHTRPASASVVKAIITLAGSLGLEPLAEGIETPQEQRLLQQLGCRLGQGYLFARPGPATGAFWLQAPGPLGPAAHGA